MTFIKSLQEKYRSDKIFLAEWILAIATGAFIFLTSSTWDLQSLTQWSVNVWHVLFNGHPHFLGLLLNVGQRIAQSITQITGNRFTDLVFDITGYDFEAAHGMFK